MEKEKIVGVHWDQFERANGETNMQRSSTHVYNSEINERLLHCLAKKYLMHVDGNRNIRIIVLVY